MQLDRAREIIRSLADGRDPVTDLPFSPDSPYQQGDTVRALFMALEALERSGSSRRSPDLSGRNETETEGRRRIDPNKPKVGANWTPEEEEQLRNSFAEFKRSTENLPYDSSAEASAKAEAKEAAFADWRGRAAAAHGRTTGAITSRLARLGLIEDTARTRAGHGNRPIRLGATSERSRVPSDSPSPTMPADLSQEEKDNLPF